MVELLCKYLGQKGFSHITKQDDGFGIDITAEKDGKIIGFACNATNNSIDSDFVQSAYSGQPFYDCSAVVVASLGPVTENAKQLAAKYKVKIWDKKALNKIGIGSSTHIEINQVSSPSSMMAIKCEMCNSNDILKENGFFVCQSCGTKYTLKEAQKLMLNINIEQDNSKELEGLYTSARDAEATHNDATAKRLYEILLQKDPTNWEPIFFTTYYSASACRVFEMKSAMISVNNCLESVVSKIYSSSKDKTTQKESILRVVNKVLDLCVSMADTAVSINNSSNNISTFHQDIAECVERILPAAHAAFYLGDLIENFWSNDKEFHQYIATPYLCGLNCLVRVVANTTDARVKQYLKNYSEKIVKYDPNCTNYEVYKKAVTYSKDGCYIATSIYGSYNCPEVWTLRRFRDLYLKKSWYGRLFIVIYYAISPHLVKHFGNTILFKKFWKPKLDLFVEKLNANGYSSKPYYYS